MIQVPHRIKDAIDPRSPKMLFYFLGYIWSRWTIVLEFVRVSRESTVVVQQRWVLFSGRARDTNLIETIALPVCTNDQHAQNLLVVLESKLSYYAFITLH
jgi:hypothetical protein